MPKLRKVEVKENSISWNEIKVRENNREINISVPIREFKVFQEKGMIIEKVHATFKKII